MHGGGGGGFDIRLQRSCWSQLYVVDIPVVIECFHVMLMRP